MIERPCLALNLSCFRTGSAETPKTAVPARVKAGARLRLTEPAAMPARSDVAADNEVPVPPFYGDRIVKGIALGDYAAGPSHVLPTGGTPRWASGLSAIDFLKRTSVLTFTRDGLARLAPDVQRLADLEGLSAHRASVDIRLDDSTNHHPKRSGQ